MTTKDAVSHGFGMAETPNPTGAVFPHRQGKNAHSLSCRTRSVHGSPIEEEGAPVGSFDAFGRHLTKGEHCENWTEETSDAAVGSLPSSGDFS